jgi:Skp family chaperone for outer membrane proteins
MRSDLTNVTSDSFAAFRELLAVISNARKSTKLLSSIERRLAAVQNAEAKLAADRAAHDEKLSRENAELNERRNKLVAKEIDVMARESRAREAEEFYKQDRLNRLDRSSSGFMAGSGLKREP